MSCPCIALLYQDGEALPRYLLVVDEHGGVEGLGGPADDIGGLGGRHVDQHTLGQEQRG